jgi:hypothetical protein
MLRDPNSSAHVDKASPIERPVDARGKLNVQKSILSEYFPMITRGFTGDESQEETPEVVGVGWKHDVTSRKEREEGLR